MQAQCQKDLKGLNKQIETRQSDLEKAQQELQEQQKTESAVQKRIAEAERRLQVNCVEHTVALHGCALHRHCMVSWHLMLTVPRIACVFLMKTVGVVRMLGEASLGAV